MVRLKSRPKPQALDEDSVSESAIDQTQLSDGDVEEPILPGRLSRKAKTDAIGHAIWVGAAPKGPKPKEKVIPTDSSSKKRSASTARQSGRNKSAKKGHVGIAPDEDVNMVGLESETPVVDPKPRESSRRARRMLVDSDPEAEGEQRAAIPAAPAPSHAAASKNKPLNPSLVVPSGAAAADTAFADEEEADSDGGNERSERSDDEQDLDGDNNEDLQGLEVGALRQKLVDETPRWANEEDGDDGDDYEEDFPTYPELRSLSRASFSSGHQSVPESEHIDISSDDEEESDPGMRAAFAGINAAHQRAPAPRPLALDRSGIPATHPTRTQDTSTRKSLTKARTRPAEPTQPQKVDLAALVADKYSKKPEKPRGKREVQREHERPRWNAETSMPRAPARKPGIVKVKLEVKPEPADVGLPPPTAHTGSIDIRFDGKRVGLKNQHPDVKKTGQLAIDYYLGFHLLKNSYPDVLEATKFAKDALLRSARHLGFKAIEARLIADDEYREALTTLVGRVSTFRGQVKPAATSSIYGNYKVQHGCADLVARLLAGVSYIYPHRPDKFDPKSSLVIPGKPDGKKPFEHEGIPAVIATFFQGQESIAEKIAALFNRNENGNLEVPQPMVAMSCAGLHSTFDDWSSGEHRPTNFDGHRVQEIYELHILLLKKLETDKPVQYHETMERIFLQASRGSVAFAKSFKVPPSLLQQEALAMLDLDSD
ncbi:hypothetical protein DFH07DRAFT_948993 [Mycena maculata]|uniref:DUF6532 domain-containing protein n=1 Tax=Mycena maculata TaxID=230809 RepID=A0AAD7KEU0_9AGAR|nr:hypothetical protein DFH07DRAFT_948993 [Mycena maculata]